MEEGGFDVLLNALNYIKSNPALDPERVIVIALSNGGLGAGLIATKLAPRVKALVFISSIIMQEQFRTSDFVSKFRDKPILIIHGKEDDRIPFSLIDTFSKWARSNTLDVKTEWFDKDDHFLFFAQRNEVLNNIADWACSKKLWDCLGNTKIH